MTSTVTIEKLVYGGDGLGRIDGQVVLAPFVLPGEEVELATARVKTGLLRGDSLKVLAPSPHRIDPRCEYFGVCGGCQYQHAGYSYQLEQKTAILRETLKRLGQVTYEADIPVISAEPWAYRNRIQLHFAHNESGFHKQSSHDLCAIDHCYISAPLLVDAIAAIQKSVKSPDWPAFLSSLELFTNGQELQLNVLDSSRPVAARFFEWCRSFLPTLAPGSVEYSAAGFNFRISGGSFFQVNRFLIDELVTEVLSDSTGDYAVDCYAGVGLFSLPLTNRFAKVNAVERGGSAFRDLEFNITRSGVAVNPMKASAENYLASSLDSSPDLLVIDPPRSGLGQEATRSLLKILPARVTLVSCDPATLARDLKQLLESYRIRRLALIDLFPQTYHFETIAHLEKK